jgi:hypothetical protein
MKHSQELPAMRLNSSSTHFSSVFHPSLTILPQSIDMARRLVTIATFDQPAQARLAENALKEAGIASTVSDENLVAMDWLLSNAVGGAKVQVWEEDAEKAVELLESRFGEDGENLGAMISPEEFAAEAEAAAPEKADEEPNRWTSRHDERDLPPAAADSRENYARRVFFASWLGILFPPLTVYALYLFLHAALGEGELSSRGKFNLLVGGFALLTGLLFLWFILRIALGRCP